MNEYDLQRRVWEGQKASEVLDNEQYKLAYETVEQELLEKWKSSPVRDAEGREKLFLMLTMLSKVQQAMNSVLETGKVAKADLNYKQSIADRVKETLHL
jgi:hypothetical protein